MRILVAQTRPRLISEGGAAPLAIGVLRWIYTPDPLEEGDRKILRAPQPALTVIAKATFSYADCESASDPASLNPEPEALSLDCLWNSEDIQIKPEDEDSDSNIWYPSDFAPFKPDADILLAGHAYASRPQAQISAQIRISEWLRTFTLASKNPSMKIPLRAEHIQLAHGMAPGERVGADPTPEYPAHHPLAFDYGQYQRAPKSSQIKSIAPDAPVELVGLNADAERKSFQLPGFLPLVYVEGTSWNRDPLHMTCDTLWLDTDRELMVLVWRSVILFDRENDRVERLFVTLGQAGKRGDFADIWRELPRAVYGYAAEPEFLDEDDTKPAAQGAEAMRTKFEAWRVPSEPTLPLEKYAYISAELAERPDTRRDCLKRYGFSEDLWVLEERGWLQKISHAATAGDIGLVTRYGELFVAAQDKLGDQSEGRETIDEYALLKVEIEEAENPIQVLKARNMSLAQWMRQDRRWTRDALNNKALKADIERRIAAYRIRRTLLREEKAGDTLLESKNNDPEHEN